MVSRMLIEAAVLLTVCGSVLSILQVQPFMVAVQTGQEVQFTCRDPDNKTLDAYLEWSFSQDNLTIAIPSSGRIQSQNLTLTITNITVQDSRTYTCTDSLNNKTETGVLKVYIMPDYLTEGLIIAGICLGLILVLVVGSILSMARQRKQSKRRLLEAKSNPAKKRPKYKLAINH